jgi:predicted nucleic acid-binding protein
MAGRVCVDASVALTFLLPQDLTPHVYSLWQTWADQDIELVTAPLFFAEVTSVLREHVYHGLLGVDEGEQAFATFLAMPVRSVSPATLQARAWSLAKKHNRPRAYDAQYLAVAAILGCDLWTGDRRLVNALNAPWVRWVGDYRSPRRGL